MATKFAKQQKRRRWAETGIVFPSSFVVEVSLMQIGDQILYSILISGRVISTHSWPSQLLACIEVSLASKSWIGPVQLLLLTV